MPVSVLPSSALDLRFAAVWNGSQIGAHCVSVRPATDGGLTTVRTEIELDVRWGPITVFRYRHESLEHWQSGRLQAITSRTEEGSSTYIVEGARGGDGFALRGPLGENTTNQVLLTSNNLWTRAITREQQIIDAQWGTIVPLAWEEAERQQILDGVDVDHFRFSTPEWRGSVWYDGSAWVRAALTRSDHTIMLEPTD